MRTTCLFSEVNDFKFALFLYKKKLEFREYSTNLWGLRNLGPNLMLGQLFLDFFFSSEYQLVTFKLANQACHFNSPLEIREGF